MDHALLDANIARRALSWLDGEPITVETFDTVEFCDTEATATPDAEVHATDRELVIQLDLTQRGARDIRVLVENSGVLHVLFEQMGSNGDALERCRRRFDFADAFDVRKARASLRFGVLTVRVPRHAGFDNSPVASTGRVDRGYATGSA